MQCNRCLYDDSVPYFKISGNQCNYCDTHDEMEEQYPDDKRGTKILRKLAEDIRKKARKRGQKYDAVVGVSGGCDSSYLLHMAVKVMGLRVLAVHFNNGYDTDIAKANMQNLITILGCDFEVWNVNKKEYNDIYKAFFEAGVPDIEACTDIGLMGALYRKASEYRVRNIFIGHSFRTEGISPIGWSYMDGGYIKDVHDKFGDLLMETFPNMDFMSFLKWALIDRIKRVRPLYYTRYNKKEVRKFLTETYNWKWYDGHHKESLITDFVKNYWAWERYGVDKRYTELSALVRSGQITKEMAVKKLASKPSIDKEVLHFVQKALNFSDSDLKYYLSKTRKTHVDFYNYKKLFRHTRLLWWIALKLGTIPKSFYLKYCTRGI
jgi:tRNA(Ile)-lysidine synthase TilS/MesJ